MKKRWLIWIVLVAAALLAAWLYFRPKRIRPVSGAKLLFIGSSSTAGTGYVDKIAAAFPQLTVERIAQVGATTDWMITNALSAAGSGQYAGVFLLGGLNDIYATGDIEGAKQNIMQLIDAAKNAGSTVTVITLQPSQNYYAYTPEKGQQTLDLNSWITSGAGQHFTVDLYRLATLEDGTQNGNYFSDDWLHLSDFGHTELSSEIINTSFA